MTRSDFRWGVSTSAFQIEGGRFEGGKGESIWDRFSDQGRLAHPGDVACDHYHRLEEDLDLMAELGVGSYHFSMAWTRVLPDGTGEPSSEGLAFYRRLIDGLQERGIEPWPTLYHWDLPQALQDRGGWASRETVDAFREYAAVASRSFPTVRHWMTHNEPWVVAYLGHLYGVFAPGKTDWATAITASHNLLVSHGLATETIRGHNPDASIGLSLDCRPATPATQADLEATRVFDGFRNRWFFDPVFGRGYPDDIVRHFYDQGRIDGVTPSYVRAGDLDLIATPIDFLGLNYYTTSEIRAGEEEVDEAPHPPGPDQDGSHTEMGWLIDPEGLTTYLIDLKERYDPPSIVITENGASYSDRPDSNGRVRDTRRIDYIDRHLNAVAESRRLGVPVDGYFVWSFLDNLEWTQGFDQRFGLVWVDPESQARIPKDSFYWYQKVTQTGGPGDLEPSADE